MTIMRTGLRLTLAASALLLGWAPLAAAAEPVKVKGGLTYESHLLRLDGPVRLTIYEDLDRDGLVDVLAVHSTDDPRDPPRNLVVFFQRARGFLERPDLRYRLRDDVCVIDVGNVEHTRDDQELLLLTGRDLHILALPRDDAAGTRTISGEGRHLLDVDTVFAAADPYEIAKRDFAQERDDAKRATLFLPRTSGYRVYHPDDGYAVGQDLRAEHAHSVRRGGYGVRVAELHLADLDGDGREDLAFTHMDRLRAYFARPDGRFAAEPSLLVDLEMITEVDLDAPLPEEELVGFTVDDFDGDGRADLFVRKVVVKKKAVVNDRQQYQLFRNQGGRFGKIPDEAFVLKSFDDPRVLDIDDDGKLDIVTGYFELSLGNIVKALITKSFSIELSFFLYGVDGFPDQPNETRDFSIRISLSNMDENFAPAVEIEGDYDGDGHKDFLLQSEDREVEIFLADTGGKRLFTKKAAAEAEVYACNELHVDDFNGDGRADLAFDRFPDRDPFDTRWVHVVLSR